MDHVELTPYPFPPGVTIPRLMPFQEYPWNGDGYLAAEVLRLKEAHGLTKALETGTCLGSTTLWLANNFVKVDTCETNVDYYRMACARFAAFYPEKKTSYVNDRFFGPITAQGRDSIEVISLAMEVDFIFLDAHWGPNCPLLNELTMIAEADMKPCIIIHDFQVPGTDFGFDKMPDGRPFNLDLIAAHLHFIYGHNRWRYTYPTKVEGARRGWISIEPL